MNTQDNWPLRWDLLLRYRLIEIVALWEGRLTTNHLMAAFGIGRQQASKDINTYLRDYAPDNLLYDPQLKGYRPNEPFKPVFTQGLADEYLQAMHAREDLAVSFEQLAIREVRTAVLTPPMRDLRPAVLRPVLKAAREGKRVEICYASLAHPEPEYRVIQPHTVVYNGYRWHVRAWCEKSAEYRDFVLSRISDDPEITLPGSCGRDGDEAWNTRVRVAIGPDPRLNGAQQALIERDYAMKDGVLTIETRAALVNYVLQHLRLDTNGSGRSPESQQIVLLNKEMLKPWLTLVG